MREVEVHTNMGIPVATITKYSWKRRKLYIVICHCCSKGSNIAKIAEVSSFDMAKQALELHLARHGLDYNYVLQVVVTSGKSKVVEFARYYYLARPHVEKIGLEAFIEGMTRRHSAGL
jgi:hypothetical protein